MIPFTLTSQISAREYATYALRKYLFRPRMVLLCLLSVGSIIVNVGQAMGLVPDDAVTDYFPWEFMILVPLVIGAAVVQSYMAYNNTPRLRNEVAYTFSEDELRGKSVDSEWCYKWEAFVRLRETGKFFLLYTTKFNFELIKKEGLTAEQLDFVRMKVSKHSI